MRIAFVVSAFPLPSETFILGQITGMIARGHEVDIYAEARVDRGSVHPDVERYGRAAASLTLLYEAVPLLERGPYDVVHCQFGTVGARVVALRRIGAATGKLVTSFRGYDAPASTRKTIPGTPSSSGRGTSFSPSARRSGAG